MTFQITYYPKQQVKYRIPTKEIVAKVSSICSIEENLVKEMRGIVGLRNIIVHLYADIDYDLILRELKVIVNNMLKFVSELIKCIDRLGLDP